MDREYIIKQFKEFGIELNEIQADQFNKYYELLIDWNSRMNLTAITEYEDVITKHFIDSASIVKVCDITNQSIIDIGTGAGFPGIPIKILFPDTTVTLLDSLQKRVGFLNEVIKELGLTNIKAVHGRAEDFGRNREYREQYDVCVSRAVANLSTLSEFCIPFVKVGGFFISYKSEKAADEINESGDAIPKLGGSISNILRFEMGENSRTLIVIAKSNSTSEFFPRKAGVPLKKPLR